MHHKNVYPRINLADKLFVSQKDFELLFLVTKQDCYFPDWPGRSPIKLLIHYI